MTTTEAEQKYAVEMALRFLARANPPPILFRYRRPSDWAIDEISKQELYAATSEELNDPFECRAPVVWNVELMKEQFIRHAPAFGISPEKAAEEFDLSRDWGIDTFRSFGHQINTIGCAHKDGVQRENDGGGFSSASSSNPHSNGV